MSSRRAVRLSLLCLGLCGVFVLALHAGEYNLAYSDVSLVIANKFRAFFGDGTASGMSKMHEIIVWNIRLPRLFLASLAGAALAVSGVVYQGCFRNPLVEPFILGVSSGAACGAALAIVFPLLLPQGQVTAFVFALGAVASSYMLARNRNETPTVTLVLAGIIVGALFSAFVGILKYLAADTQLREITFWMMGGFYYATWRDVGINLLGLLPCLFIACGWGWKLNVLSLGDDEARSLGINPGRSRLLFLLVSTLAAAICVSTVGIIAWVGLMMPHAARMILGPDNRWVVPGAAIMGAMYLLVCDTLARTLTTAEIPIGIVASIVGAPYLLWLLRSKGRELYVA